MAVTALAAVTTVEPDAPMARATTSGLAPRTRPARKTMLDRPGRRPAASSPAAIPAKAGIASDEFQTPSPYTKPAANRSRALAGGASRSRPRRATNNGKPVTSGIKKFGGGPVAVINPMYGVPHAARAAAAQPAGRPATRRARRPASNTSRAAQRSS